MSLSPSHVPSSRRVPVLEPSPGHGRAAIVAHVDRWLDRPRTVGEGHAVLVVLDVDVDRALPVGDDQESTRRHRLARYVDRALRSGLDDRDAVAQVDSGRFAVLRTGLAGAGAAVEATATALRVETALAGRPEGHGVRLTCGGTIVDRESARGGRRTLAAVTGAMLAGKLLSDDRVVVVVAPAESAPTGRRRPGGDHSPRRGR